jgi:hypothetical protein
MSRSHPEYPTGKSLGGEIAQMPDHWCADESPRETCEQVGLHSVGVDEISADTPCKPRQA